MTEEVKSEEIETTETEVTEATDNTPEETVEAAAESAEVTEKVDDDQDPDLAKGDSPEFQWYVVHALSQYEGRVAKALKERILNHKMSEYFSRIFIPEETVVSNVNGKKRNIKKKFFPGYVLVKMIMTKDTWHLVKNTDKITGFIGGTPENPQPISEDEAKFILGQGEGGFKKTRSAASFSTGDSVKVVEGPFASFVGTVESVNANGKLKVNVSIFGRPTPVELDDTQVEKA